MLKDTNGAARIYPSTIWSEIERAQGIDEEAAQEALGRLLSRYYGPLKTHLRFRFHTSEDQAEDWLQSFVWKKVLLKQLFGRARRGQGRFRGFLVRALDNFVLNELRQAACRTRQPSAGWVAWSELEEQGQTELAGGTEDPGAVEWARVVIEEALRRMRAQCAAQGQEARWSMFELRVVEPLLQGTPPLPYDQLVDRLGLASPSVASNTLVTAKRMFVRLLREVVAEYTEGDDLDAELRELRAALAGGGEGQGPA